MRSIQLSPKFVVRLEVLEKYLIPASILYLALPYVIFCIGWLRWYWALFSIGLLVVAVTEWARNIFRQAGIHSSSQVSPVLTFRHLLFLLLTSFVWLSLAGVGGIGYQRGDWIKHESVLQDLIEYSWPVLYDFYGSPVPLVYYIAYYLPAALIGKIGGWAWAQVALFVWTFFGLVLAMLLFWVLIRKASNTASHKITYSIFMIFVFFSGLDVVGKLIANGIGWPMISWGRIEGWGWIHKLEYSANTVLLYWAPNQALTGWIAAGLTLYAILVLRHRRISWLPLGLSMLGTPFVTIGLIPYLLAELLSDEGPLLVRFKRYFSWSNLCGLYFLLLVSLFYMSKLYEASPYVRADIPHGFTFFSNSTQMLSELGLLVAFWIMEVGVYAVLIYRSVMSKGRLWRWLFIVTFVYLSLLPLYHAGIHNDLVMRASIPAIFCLAVLVGQTVHRSTLGMPTRVALIMALILGAITAMADMGYSVVRTYRQMRGLPNEEILVDTRGIVEFYEGIPDYFLQYIGSYESPFFHYVAKKQEWTSRTDGKHYLAFADNRILFEGYDLSKDSALRPGEQVRMVSRLHVFFGAIDKNYNISLRLVAEDGKEIWKEQGWPQNRPTSVWAPTVHWFDTRTLMIPVDTPPGNYRLDLSFVEPETHDLLAATAMPEGKYLGEMVPIGYVIVGEVESRPSYLFPQPAQLDAKVALVGMAPAPEQVASQIVSPGASLSLELFWQAIAEMDRDYTGFVHLLDADGRLVAQHDHPPRNGFLPTSIWKNGFVTADGYTLLVPQDASPGTYTLVAGMYDLETGVRLPVLQNGKSLGDSFLLAYIFME